MDKSITVENFHTPFSVSNRTGRQIGKDTEELNVYTNHTQHLQNIYYFQTHMGHL